MQDSSHSCFSKIHKTRGGKKRRRKRKLFRFQVAQRFPMRSAKYNKNQNTQATGEKQDETLRLIHKAWFEAHNLEGCNKMIELPLSILACVYSLHQVRQIFYWFCKFQMQRNVRDQIAGQIYVRQFRYQSLPNDKFISCLHLHLGSKFYDILYIKVRNCKRPKGGRRKCY